MLLLGPCAVLFALITWQVVADGPLTVLDERLSRELVHPDRASELLSDLGNVQIAVPVLLIALAYAEGPAQGGVSAGPSGNGLPCQVPGWPS